jgi:NAD dependent epimerase/dehydratase
LSNGTWKGRAVLVTGAGGFIGSHLVERLVELGADVRALVRYTSTGHAGWLDSSPVRGDVDVVLGDIRDFESVQGAMCGRSVVFHLAALIGIPYSYRAAQSYVRTNIEGTLNVLQAARDQATDRIVCTSTSEVYGSAQYVPINEEHPLQGQSPYSASKIGADKIAESYYLSFGLPVSIVRPFNTYGPRQSTRAVIPTIITQALAGSEVRVGALSPTRDFNYVADTVEGFLCAASEPKAIGRTINFGSGLETSIEDLARLIGNLLGKDLTLVPEEQRVRPENSEVERLCADSGLAQRLLGWRSRVSLEQGLRQTIAWTGDNLGNYRIQEYAV